MEILYILIGIPIFLYIVINNTHQRKQFKKLEKVGIVDTATIIRSFIGAKSKLYYEYEFTIKNSKFNGFLQYSPDHGQIEIGDWYLVKYLPNDPDNISELIENQDFSLMKVNSNIE